MRHDSAGSLFLFPAMAAAQRRLVLDLGELLVLTGDRYQSHLAMELRLLRDAAVMDGVMDRLTNDRCCRILPFQHYSLRRT